jgi:carboxymethylenebutenolidase
LISIETPSLAQDGERHQDSYFARPESGKGPGLIIFAEMWGITEAKRRMADEYAHKGWCALVPNMYWRSSFTGVIPFDQADKAMERMEALDFNQAAEDAKLAAGWLRASAHCSGKIAALGFCIGGRIAFLAASRANIDAAIALYAFGIAQYPDELASMSCPLQLHYGLKDRHISKAEIEAVKKIADTNDKVEVHLYLHSGHGFFSPERPTFDPDAAKAASRRIEGLLSGLA